MNKKSMKHIQWHMNDVSENIKNISTKHLPTSKINPVDVRLATIGICYDATKHVKC